MSIHKVCVSVALATLAAAGGTPTASAQPAPPLGPFSQQSRLIPGERAAVSGDTALITAGGAVHVFERDPGSDAWTEVTALTPSDSPANFGRAIAIDGRRAIVGAESAAYVFRKRRNGAWREASKLVPSGDSVPAAFGFSVDIDGRHAIVGTGGLGGAAYIFTRDAQRWREVTRLDPADPAPITFGGGVAISNDTAMVSAQTAPMGGAAYIFDRNAGGPDHWGRVYRLPEIGSFFFLTAIDLSGDTAMVAGGEQTHYVRVHNRNLGGPNAWGREAEYSVLDVPFGSPETVAYAGIPWDIEISGDTAIFSTGTLVGQVVVLARNQGGPGMWDRVGRWVLNPDPPGLTLQPFVSLSGDTALVVPTRLGSARQEAYVLVADVDADGVRDGVDPCLRDPFNNLGGGCRRASDAYPAFDDVVTLTEISTASVSPRRSVVTATFTNTSGAAIRNPFFEVTAIGNESVLLNADGYLAGVGGTLSPDVGDGVFSPGEIVRVEFVVRHPRRATVELDVTLRGEPSP